jgi:hypothetical protein
MLLWPTIVAILFAGAHEAALQETGNLFRLLLLTSLYV